MPRKKQELGRYAHTRSFNRLAGNSVAPASRRVRTDFTLPRIIFCAVVLTVLLWGVFGSR